jgi:hypothetical protein
VTTTEGSIVTVPRSLLDDVLWLIGSQKGRPPRDAYKGKCFTRIEAELIEALDA